MLLFFTVFACQDTEPKPQGLEPTFEVPTDGPSFIPVAEVKAEFDRGAGFYFLDARPQPDYDLQHIVGAYSIPFYEVEAHFYRFPKDVWYIAYCACPHAESGIVADYFWENGHNKVAILDEGYLVWEDLGYPTEGNEPLSDEAE